jgi:hypothetical protein
MRNSYKNLLVKLSGVALLAVMAVSCKGKRNNNDCGGCYHPCYPATEYPVYNTGDGNIFVGGDATIYQTEVHNTTDVTNSGSGNVNVGNSTNVNSSNSGSQTVTQQPAPAPRTQPRPQPKPKEEEKPVVVDDTVTCSTHIHISVRGRATITR